MEVIKTLCKPAYVYLVFSTILMIVLMFQNIGNTDTYCVGSFFKCKVYNTGMVFIAKALTISFWTWFLNYLCQSGYKTVSWMFVLAPFIWFIFVLYLIKFTGFKLNMSYTPDQYAQGSYLQYKDTPSHGPYPPKMVSSIGPYPPEIVAASMPSYGLY
jgi:hypothetical protein